MGSTFLDLTNKVLRKLNEVPLTSVNFASATGFHALVKDSVQYSIDAINQDQYRWPFNYVRREETLVPNQQEYNLPSDYKIVDWSTFFLQRDDTLSVRPQPVNLMNYNEWNNWLRSSDSLGSTSLPERVIRTRHDTFIISPIPDKAYVVEFDYWRVPTPLVNSTDTTTIPSQYDYVIISGAMKHAYDFRENFEMSGKEHSIYTKGLKQMRAVEINDYDYAYDTRSHQVTARRSSSWSK